MLRQLADHFPSTHTLKMRSCRINDQFLEDILPRFPNLNQLDLYNNSVTCVGIKSIMTHAPDLKILLISNSQLMQRITQSKTKELAILREDCTNSKHYPWTTVD